MIYPVDIRNLKGKRKISMLTAYDYSMAGVLSQTDVDMILVGDSLGNVILGHKDTIPVTVEEMIHHGKAVVKGAPDKLVIIDMPFMSTGCGKKDALKNIKKVMQQTGAQAIKIEGVRYVVEVIGELNDLGIPVMGHIGLTPQSYLSFGGFKKQGTTEEAAKYIYEDAVTLAESGVFAMVLECMPDDLAAKITKEVDVPTIGIGSGKQTDGQVLVINDMIGLGVSKVPSFVKKRMNLAEDIGNAVSAFIKDIKE